MVKRIFLHATYNCTANCMHCAVPTSDDEVRAEKYVMPLESFKAITDIARRDGVEYMSIGGGEPLLHPDLMEMVDYASGKGIKVKIETNGFLLTDSIIEQLNGKLNQLCISLDGSTPQVHNGIRSSGLFNNTTNAIKHAREIGMDVAVWSVVMKPNAKETNAIIDKVQELGGNKVSFLYATPVGACYVNRDSLLVDAEEHYAIMESVKAGREGMQMRIAPYMIPFDKEEEFKLAHAAELRSEECLIYEKDILHIDPKGNMFPCVLVLGDNRFAMGNANDADALSSILRNSDEGWKKTMAMLNAQRDTAKKHGQSQTGCIGLCASFNSELDPRTGKGFLICPSKTISREWKG